jgi:hypothetical protein
MKRLAKYLAQQCFRNTVLEDLHAGITPDSQMRIPMKKIAHSELMTIRSSPSDAVKNIVEQVIVMVKN